MPDKSLEEMGLLVERVMDFMNIWTVYNDFLTGKYVPSVATEEEWTRGHMGTTLMFTLYSYFYSLMEDSEDSLNAFRVWRERFAQQEEAIAAVEGQIAPFKEELRWFRNRLGSHGSRSWAHQAKGLDLFAHHSGGELWEAMKNFKALNAALLGLSMALQGGDTAKKEWAQGNIAHIAEVARKQTPR